ncbi:flagellar biosynthetic protein FliO [Azospirillum sp. SYSU D00513]|uniref:FliO/MopB family protein n=1 Tax=Azospirillum sp. SYSU D00513 TaxID=2812561 RepID=UPI001A974423|nr:flagellar biosynthetic protein FliO [Azospirillum sp. SYSU D00513]
MTLEQYVQFASALLFVIFLIMAVGWLLRRVGFGGMMGSNARQRRLGVVEVLALDAKRRLVLVRRDDQEHLILLGPVGDRVVESGVRAGFRTALGDASASTPAPNPEASARPDELSARRQP